MPAIDLDAPIPTDKELRAVALGVLRSFAVHPGTDPALREDAAATLRRHGDQLFALHEAAEGLEPDALAVVVAIARRLALGRKAYGDLDVAHDRRDFRAQAAEEALDLAAYLAMDLLRPRVTP